jgi:4-amino-4-deoxy-L-arabinose transferase-like glycosyltransferase
MSASTRALRARAPKARATRVRGRVTARLLRGVPTAAWLCALVACLNAVAWSIITPPFEVPDEQSHFAYVEELARLHRLPSSGAQRYASDEQEAIDDVESWRINLQPEQHALASRAQQRKLESDLALEVNNSTPGLGDAGAAATEPPLYYALETIPYELGASGGVLAQLALMRLLSALMAGLAVLFTFLFVREILPSVPRAWTIAGLAVAFGPMLGFIAGGVNPESLLCAVAAALFYCGARAFRRGLTPGLAIAIGALTAAGLLTKLNFIGLVPGVLLALVLVAWRLSRLVGVRRALRTLAPGLALAAAPVCAYALVNALSHHHVLGIVSGTLASKAGHRSLLGEASYIWQLYLPRLPGMHVDFPDISPLRNIWLNGLVGDYGFEDTFFPRWVDNVAVIPVLVLAASCAREVWAHWEALRGRLAELVAYLAMAIGLLGLIGASSYLSFPAEAAAFPEPRYLLPLTPLLAAVLALAARGTGRRWGASAGALIVVLFLAHDIFSQLQVIGRYYG